MAKYVFSLDYDGCWDKVIAQFLDYCQRIEKDEGASFDINDPSVPEKVRELYMLVQGGDEITIMVGSNRQDAKVDEENGNQHGSGSCFANIERLVEEINKHSDTQAIPVVFDKMLMVDICHEGLALGGGMQAAQNALNPGYVPGYKPQSADEDITGKLLYKKAEINTQKLTTPDESKISTLYAQIHHQATIKGTPLTIEFTDDRVDILQGLQEYFSKNPELIPEGVTLQLVHYNAAAIKHQGYLKAIAEEKEVLIAIKNASTSEEGWRDSLNALIDKLENKSQKNALKRYYFELTPEQQANEKNPVDDILEGLSIEEEKLQKEARALTYNPIKGNGEIDKDYQITTRAMLELAGHQAAKDSSVRDAYGVTANLNASAEETTRAMRLTHIEVLRKISKGEPLNADGVMARPDTTRLAVRTSAIKAFKDSADALKAFRADSTTYISEHDKDKDHQHIVTQRMVYVGKTNKLVQEVNQQFEARAQDTREYTQKLYGIGARFIDNHKSGSSPGARSRTNELQILQKLKDYLEGKPVLGFSAQERAGLEQLPYFKLAAQNEEDPLHALLNSEFARSTDNDLYQLVGDNMQRTHSSSSGNSPIPPETRLKLMVESYCRVKEKECGLAGTKATTKHADKIQLAKKLVTHMQALEKAGTSGDSLPSELEISPKEAKLGGRIGELLKEVKALDQKMRKEQNVSDAPTPEEVHDTSNSFGGPK